MMYEIYAKEEDNWIFVISSTCEEGLVIDTFDDALHRLDIVFMGREYKRHWFIAYVDGPFALRSMIICDELSDELVKLANIKFVDKEPTPAHMAMRLNGDGG